MFTKIVLPRFGGSPSVWAVAMVFFQGILLFGYAYADALTRFAGRRLALPIHLGVMLGGAMFLPLAIAEGLGHADARAGGDCSCSACSRSRSDFRSSRCRRMVRCCRRGSREAAILTRTTLTSSMRRAISAACWRCSPIRSSPSRCQFELSGRALALRLLPPDRPDRASAVRSCSRATPKASCGPRPLKLHRRRRRMAVLGGACLRAFGADGRGDDACHDRRCGRAVPLGAAAVALSDHLHPGVQRAHVDSASVTCWRPSRR